MYLYLGKALRAFDFAILANKIGIQNESKISFIFFNGWAFFFSFCTVENGEDSFWKMFLGLMQLNIVIV